MDTNTQIIECLRKIMPIYNKEQATYNCKLFEAPRPTRLYSTKIAVCN